MLTHRKPNGKNHIPTARPRCVVLPPTRLTDDRPRVPPSNHAPRGGLPHGGSPSPSPVAFHDHSVFPWEATEMPDRHPPSTNGTGGHGRRGYFQVPHGTIQNVLATGIGGAAFKLFMTLW